MRQCANNVASRAGHDRYTIVSRNGKDHLVAHALRRGIVGLARFGDQIAAASGARGTEDSPTLTTLTMIVIVVVMVVTGDK